MKIGIKRCDSFEQKSVIVLLQDNLMKAIRWLVGFNNGTDKQEVQMAAKGQANLTLRHGVKKSSSGNITYGTNLQRQRQLLAKLIDGMKDVLTPE